MGEMRNAYRISFGKAERERERDLLEDIGVEYNLWRRRGERMYSSYSFTNSALDGVSGQRHASAAL
jgi:hypothetical protein